MELRQFKVESLEETFFIMAEDKYSVMEKLIYLNTGDIMFDENDFKIEEYKEELDYE